MTPEEKVLLEIKEKINLLFEKIAELKVTEDMRRAFDAERAKYQVLVDDYKTHKEQQDLREAMLNKKEAALKSREEGKDG